LLLARKDYRFIEIVILQSHGQLQIISANLIYFSFLPSFLKALLNHYGTITVALRFFTVVLP
jgi:hypothetical protein